VDEVHEVNDLGCDIPLSESYSIVFWCSCFILLLY